MPALSYSGSVRISSWRYFPSVSGILPRANRIVSLRAARLSGPPKDTRFRIGLARPQIGDCYCAYIHWIVYKMKRDCVVIVFLDKPGRGDDYDWRRRPAAGFFGYVYTHCNSAVLGALDVCGYGAFG